MHINMSCSTRDRQIAKTQQTTACQTTRKLEPSVPSTALKSSYHDLSQLGKPCLMVPHTLQMSQMEPMHPESSTATEGPRRPPLQLQAPLLCRPRLHSDLPSALAKALSCDVTSALRL